MDNDEEVIAHELGHALDFALGPDTEVSVMDTRTHRTGYLSSQGDRVGAGYRASIVLTFQESFGVNPSDNPEEARAIDTFFATHFETMAFKATMGGPNGPIDMHGYYDQPTEIFARTFTEWLAREGTNPDSDLYKRLSPDVRLTARLIGAKLEIGNDRDVGRAPWWVNERHTDKDWKKLRGPFEDLLRMKGVIP